MENQQMEKTLFNKALVNGGNNYDEIVGKNQIVREIRFHSSQMLKHQDQLEIFLNKFKKLNNGEEFDWNFNKKNKKNKKEFQPIKN